MKLTFLGTRGNIDARTRRHRMHSTMRISYYGTNLVIDCGEDWLGRIADWDVAAIFDPRPSRPRLWAEGWRAVLRLCDQRFVGGDGEF